MKKPPIGRSLYHDQNFTLHTLKQPTRDFSPESITARSIEASDHLHGLANLAECPPGFFVDRTGLTSNFGPHIMRLAPVACWALDLKLQAYSGFSFNSGVIRSQVADLGELESNRARLQKLVDEHDCLIAQRKYNLAFNVNTVYDTTKAAIRIESSPEWEKLSEVGTVMDNILINKNDGIATTKHDMAALRAQGDAKAAAAQAEADRLSAENKVLKGQDLQPGDLKAPTKPHKTKATRGNVR